MLGSICWESTESGEFSRTSAHMRGDAKDRLQSMCLSLSTSHVWSCISLHKKNTESERGSMSTTVLNRRSSKPVYTTIA